MIATPLKLRGLPGELAKQNALRNPRRTSSTAAALMIGLTLVVSMGVFASSLKASFGDVISDQTNADLYLSSSSAQGPGFSPSVIAAVQAVEGVDKVSAGGWGEARFDNGDTTYSAIDPATADEVMNLEVSQGSVADLGEDGVMVSKKIATAKGWKLGDEVPAEFAVSGKHQLHVVAIYDGKGWITRQLRDQHRRAERLRRARSSSPRVWSPSPPAPTRRTSRRPSRPPWPTTRTPRCWTRRASRRRPAASSGSC